MPNVSSTYRARWRSRNHVGPAKPTVIVKVQRGYMARDHRPLEMLDGSSPEFGFIQGSKFNATPWQATWVNTGDPITVPNVSSVSRQKSLDGKGIESATIAIENVVFKQVVGAAGIFHAVKRGYMAPWQGFVGLGRVFSGEPRNEWYDVLNGGYRVDVWEGYGDQLVHVYAGLIDDTDTHVLPDVITLTSRSFGLMFSDSRVFGWNKPAEIPSPIVFADRNQAFRVTKKAGGAAASSEQRGHPARSISAASDSSWISAGHSTPGNTEYIEIRLPRGRYVEFYLRPHYAGMSAYLSIFARDAKVDGAPVADGWLGAGSVPGANGGHSFLRQYDSLGSDGMVRRLPFTLDCGDNTILRVSFRNLQLSSELGDYRAGAERLIGYQQNPSDVKRSKHWIIVDDAADVLRWVFMWAGFKEWDIENFGVRLKEPMTFHQADFFQSIIDHMLEQGDFVFFVAAPSADADSIGVPTFRRKGAFRSAATVREEVRHTTLITGLETKFSKEVLTYIIRVRGKPEKGGSALGEEALKRVMAVYRPPWSGIDGRLNRVIKHTVYTNEGLETQGEVNLAAVLVAVNQALAAYGGSCEMPGYPWDLDQQVSIVDVPSGTNTRMWIHSVNSTITTGEAAAYTVTLEGSMLDSPDTRALVKDYLLTLAAMLAGAE